MADVQFEEEQSHVSPLRSTGESNMALWMMNKHIAKNAQQAHFILAVTAIILIAVAFLIIFISGNDVPVPRESFT